MSSQANICTSTRAGREHVWLKLAHLAWWRAKGPVVQVCQTFSIPTITIKTVFKTLQIAILMLFALLVWPGRFGSSSVKDCLWFPDSKERNLSTGHRSTEDLSYEYTGKFCLLASACHCRPVLGFHDAIALSLLSCISIQFLLLQVSDGVSYF